MKRIIIILIFLSSAELLSQNVKLQHLTQYKITPNSEDSIGVFCRIFYNAAKDKFYIIYGGRKFNSPKPFGVLDGFSYREYDKNMKFTGVYGYLSEFTSAGDYAMVMVDNYFYHLTNSQPSEQYGYKLSKYDDQFKLIESINIDLDIEHESNIDQLLSYANNHLIVGALYEPKYKPVTPPKPDYHGFTHIFNFSLDLKALEPNVILKPSFFSWGASAIFNNDSYYIVTFERLGKYDLYAFEFDTNWNYRNKYLLSEDGQWSQGLIWDGKYYYVAYHEGEHQKGNVVIGIYDKDWNILYKYNVTNFIYNNGFNANRPHLIKVEDKIYISYDVETYHFTPLNNLKKGKMVENKDWQAYVDKFQVVME